MAIRTFGFAALAGGALVLAACGGGSSADDGPTTLEELFESQFDSQRFTEQQEAVRDCMVEQGFEYTPIDMRNANVRRFDRGDFGDEDWVRENGFGITTTFGSLEDPQPADGGGDDANAAYRESLSPEQQEAYDEALYGERTDIPGEGGSFSMGPGGAAGGGCFGKAFEETGGDLIDDSLDEALEDLREQIENDERIVEANREWAECMSDEGFSYASRDEAIQDIASRMNEILGVDAPEGPGGGNVIIRRPGDDPNATYDQAAMNELREEEKRIALASFECGKDTIDEVEPKVREEYEEQFIEDHPELTAE